MSPSSFRSCAGIALAILSLTMTSICSPLSLPIPGSNLTFTPNMTAVTPSTDGCAVDLKYWKAIEFSDVDCGTALGMFFKKYVFPNPDATYEFLSSSASNDLSGDDYPHVWAPKKETYQTCTVAVGMLSDIATHFGEAYMPGIRKIKPYPYADLSTYRNLYLGAGSVFKGCVDSDTTASGRTSPGWKQLGRDSGIGIFIWPTGSSMNDFSRSSLNDINSDSSTTR